MTTARAFHPTHPDLTEGEPKSSPQLTDRDLDILTMVYTYRGCTTDQLHRRFWRESSPPAACYRRIALLARAGYLSAHRLPSLTGLGSGKRFLAIGPAARPILAEHLGISQERIDYLNPPTPVFALHHQAISDFRLALELAAGNSPRVTLLSWIDEATLRGRPMRVTDTPDSSRPGREQTITLVPDGAFTLIHSGRRQQFYLEMDMGTIPPHRLNLKVRGYLIHQLKSPVPILFVVPNPDRADLIVATVVREATRLTADPSRFFVATRTRVMWETLLAMPIWKQVGVDDLQAIIPTSDGAASAPGRVLEVVR